MSDGEDKTDLHLDAYLDGLLSDEARRAFERQMDQDERLRSTVQAHRLIEESLARVFGEPGGAAFLNDLATAPSLNTADTQFRRQPRQGARRKALAIAAVLGLLLFSGWANREALLSSRIGRVVFRSARFDVATLYAAEISKGFRPQLVCETEEQFRGLMLDRFGQALAMQRSPGVSAVGWSYSELISPRTLHLLATIELDPGRNGASPGKDPGENARVLVFFDRIGAGPAPRLSSKSGLHLFHRVFGNVDAYEVTPLNVPRILEMLNIPS